MSSEKRGLASADEETRQRVAKAGGEARAQDLENLAEAGRKKGEKVAEERGSEFYSDIGKKGGEARAEDKESPREAGRKGGQR